MPRKSPQDRLEELVRSAAQVFIRSGGYRRTQMADIARFMGVSPGTLYLYVESKEALFDLVIRYADREGPWRPLPEIPVATPAPGATLEYVRERLDQDEKFARLEQALAITDPSDPAAELEGILREIYGRLYRNRWGVKLVDACAVDYPDLAELWFESARRRILAPIARYVASRIEHGHFRPVPDLAIAARLLLETCVTWAVHRHWDPQPQPMDDALAEDTVVHVLVGALVAGA